MSAPAGWYTDPAGTAGERWWSGAEWSTSTRPASSVTSAFVPPAAAPTQAAPYAPQQSSYGYLDVRSTYPSSMAGAQTGRSTGSKVVLGLVIGAVGFVVLAILAAIAIPTFLNQRAKGHSAAAAAKPVIVGSNAPATFAGLPATTSRGKLATSAFNVPLDTWTSGYLDTGSSWAWARPFGSGNQTTLVIGNAPPALTAGQIDLDLGGSGTRMYKAEVKGLSSPTAPVEIPVTVPGRMFCGTAMADLVPLTLCVWTDGKEELAVVQANADPRALGATVATGLLALEGHQTGAIS